MSSKKIFFSFLSLFVAILSSSVIYAAFNQELTINGKAILRVNSEIRITDFKVIEQNGAVELYNSRYNKDTVNMGVNLENSSSYIKYQVTVTNKGAYNYDFMEMIKNSNSNNNVLYQIEGITRGDVINKNTSKTFTIKLTTNGTNQETNLQLQLKAVEHIESYVVGNYNYTGSYQTLTVPHTGEYKLEVWGAQGGSSNGGPGGYAVGNINLTKGEKYYIYVGGQGSQASEFGGAGYNGGGLAYAAYGGGGMTHISKVNTDSFNPTGSTEIRTNAIYPAQTITLPTITYQGKTAGSSWSSAENKNWTIYQQFTANASATVTFQSFSAKASANSIDPVCRITVNGSVATTNDDGGSGYNFLCQTSVNKGDVVTFEVSSYRDTGLTASESDMSATVVLPERIDQETIINYSDNINFSPENVIILAGGGGGATSSTNAKGGSGGGYQSGQTTVQSSASYSYSANQTSGYKQGLGAPASVLTSSGGAGGGWYGGKVSNNTNGGAGGGSGYIGNTLLTNKHMTCYNCQSNTSTTTYTNNTSNVSATATADYAKNGNGYAKVTFVKIIY